MFNVEKDLLEAVKNGCGEERHQAFIHELNNEDIDSELVYNGIIECFDNEDYLDGVTDTLMAIEKERTETGTRKSKESTFLIIGGVVLMGYSAFKIISGVRSIIRKRKK